MTDQPGYPPTPMLDKVKGLGGANQIVGDFIEWLGLQGLAICAYDPKAYGGTYFPNGMSRDQIIAAHFEIDQEAMEREKDAILAWHRQVTRQGEESAS